MNRVPGGRERIAKRGYRLTMLELSRFFGVIIRMYCELGPHHPPHFHAYHGDQEAVYGLEPVELLVGNLPRRQARMVEV